MVEICVLIKVRRRHTYTHALIDEIVVLKRVAVNPDMFPNDPTQLLPTILHRLIRTHTDAHIVVIRYAGARVPPHALIAVTP